MLRLYYKLFQGTRNKGVYSDVVASDDLGDLVEGYVRIHNVRLLLFFLDSSYVWVYLFEVDFHVLMFVVQLHRHSRTPSKSEYLKGHNKTNSL